MAYLSPNQITGQVLLNMHANGRDDQIVTSSNVNINLEFISRGTKIVDGGKLYPKRMRGNLSSVDSTLVTVNKLMNNVTEFTLALWVYCKVDKYTGGTSFLNGYINLFANDSTRKITGRINGYPNDEVYLASCNDGEDPWKHIAVVSHNGKITFYVNGTRQIDVAYQEYKSSKYNEVWYDHKLFADDRCLILNQAVWTDNFTPPEEPLLGDLKYKRLLYPKNAIITDSSDLMVKIY